MTAGRCADLSEEAGESLAATATSVDTWLLVEVGGTWPRDVSDASRARRDGLGQDRRLAGRRPLVEAPLHPSPRSGT